MILNLSVSRVLCVLTEDQESFCLAIQTVKPCAHAICLSGCLVWPLRALSNSAPDSLSTLVSEHTGFLLHPLLMIPDSSDHFFSSPTFFHIHPFAWNYFPIPMHQVPILYSVKSPLKLYFFYVDYKCLNKIALSPQSVQQTNTNTLKVLSSCGLDAIGMDAL